MAEWDDYLRLGTAKRQPHHLTLLEELHCQMYIREVRGLRFRGTEDGKCFQCGFFAHRLQDTEVYRRLWCCVVVLLNKGVARVAVGLYGYAKSWTRFSLSLFFCTCFRW